MLQIIGGIMFLAFASAAARAADIRYTPYYTNATIVANSLQIIQAIKSGDSKKIAGIEPLVGSQVAFFGSAGYTGGGTNINIFQFVSQHSNRVDSKLHIILNVKLRPWRDVRPPGAASFIEVLGSLEKVDLENRVICIQAKPSDYRISFTL